jgi:hypothetical protein
MQQFLNAAAGLPLTLQSMQWLIRVTTTTNTLSISTTISTNITNITNINHTFQHLRIITQCAPLQSLLKTTTLNTTKTITMPTAMARSLKGNTCSTRISDQPFDVSTQHVTSRDSLSLSLVS